MDSVPLSSIPLSSIPPNSALLEQNLASIATHRLQLADAIRHAETESAVTMRITPTRTDAVNLNYYYAGQERSAHSRIDPQRGARKLVEHLPTGELYIFLGLGMGYQIEALLALDPACYAVVIEHDFAALRIALAGRDMRALLSDRRVEWLVAPRRGEIDAALRLLWVPALMGDVVQVPLRTRIESQPSFFSDAQRELEYCLASLRQSNATQAKLGRRWLRNMLLNLPLIARSDSIVASINGSHSFTEVALIMAGPTLATHLTEIAELQGEIALIAVDTALPVLRARAIIPDVVLSIDCQQISYLHFMEGIDSRTLLALAIGSSPTLARLSERVLFCQSDHPLAYYIGQRLGSLQAVDMTAGNVGHAAFSLALSLGAKRIRLFGADFRYTNGVPYPRGTYLYDYYDGQCRRLQPTEGALYGFMLRDPKAAATAGAAAGANDYTTPLLEDYRRHFEYAVATCPAETILPTESPDRRAAHKQQPPKRLPADLSANRPSDLPSGPAPHQSSELQWQTLLHEYAVGLERLSAPTAPLRLYFEHISQDERLLVLTVAPLIAHLRSHNSLSPQEAFEQARHTTLKLIAQQLQLYHRQITT